MNNDEIIFISIDQFNQLHERFQHLKVHKIILLSTLISSFLFALESHIADSIFFFDKFLEFYNFLFKCRFKFLNQSFKFFTKEFKIYYLNFRFVDQAYF